MLSRALRAVPVKTVAAQQRKMSVLPNVLQGAVWRKSTINYIAYIVFGCVVLEGVYGGVTDYMWDSYNYGVSSSSLDLCLRGNFFSNLW
jgi:hypothetical protein